MVSDRDCANYICLAKCRSDREKYCRKCAQHGDVVGLCKQCDKIYNYWATKINRQFCSPKCSHKFFYLKNHEERKKYQRGKYKHKVYQKLCNHCGKDYECYNKRRQFCTKKCSAVATYKNRAEAMKKTRDSNRLKFALGIFGAKHRVENNPYINDRNNLNKVYSV